MTNNGKSTGFIATGAELINIDGTHALIWGHSREPVDVREGGMFRPNSGYQWDVVDNHYLFLEPKQHSSQLPYRQNWPPFHLKPWLYSDNSYEFACMKTGIFIFLGNFES